MKMPVKDCGHSTLVGVASLLLQTLALRGIDPDSFLLRLGVTPGEYSDPNSRISSRLMQAAWRLAVEETADECLGLGLADVLQPAALHGLGLSMMASENLADSLKRIVCYQRFLSTTLKISLLRQQDGYLIDYPTQHLGFDPHPASVDGALSVLVKMFRIIAGPSVNPLKVTLLRERPSHCGSRYEHFFGCPVDFSSRHIQLLFGRNTIERQLSTANRELARINDQVVIEYLKRFDAQSITARLRALIIDALPGGLISEKAIAQQLNMSQRSLQRQLHQENISYQTILSETRQQLAKEYLENSDRLIIEIGYMLGFSEPSNFSRAFKRWTGQSPQQFRVSAGNQNN